MGRIERRGDLGDEPDRLAHREGATLGNEIAQRPAADVLHDDECTIAVLPLVEHGDDVRMAHRRGAAGRGGPLAELHRHVAVELFVARLPDLGRAPAVDPLHKAVAAGDQASGQAGQLRRPV